MRSLILLLVSLIPMSGLSGAEYTLMNYTVCDITVEVGDGDRVMEIDRGADIRFEYPASMVPIVVEDCRDQRWTFDLPSGGSVIESNLDDDDSLIDSFRYGRLSLRTGMDVTRSRQTYRFTLHNTAPYQYKTVFVSGVSHGLSRAGTRGDAVDFEITSYFPPVIFEYDTGRTVLIRDGYDYHWDRIRQLDGEYGWRYERR